MWEHTRGRYSCMQCAFSTASRPAMTLHLEDHRPGAPAAPALAQPRRDAPAGKAEKRTGGGVAARGGGRGRGSGAPSSALRRPGPACTYGVIAAVRRGLSGFLAALNPGALGEGVCVGV